MVSEPILKSKTALREAEREALLRKKKTERRRNKRHNKDSVVTNAHVSSSNIEPGSEDEYEIEYIPEAIGDEYADLISKFAPVRVENESMEGSAEYSAEMGNIMDADAQRRAAEAAAVSILELTEKTGKEKRLAGRMTIAALKESVSRPDLVDSMDNCSPDPVTLLVLKAYRNVVQVPRHWSTKRNYMAAKRGVDKPPYRLPEYVEQTGIAKIRQAVLAKEAEKDIKAKQRAKMRPKTGKLDIDYQVLHDAFFKYQTKPSFLTKFGDIYFEGRENETRFFHKKPGHISAALREALGIVDQSLPPPWLVSMQRFGPPPSYPNMRIPGLNAPIPIGTEWGYHPGGWGKPPVDQFGNPMYGGSWNPELDRQPILDIEKLTADSSLWGHEIEEPPSDDEEEVYQQPAVVVAVPVIQPVQYSQGVAVHIAQPASAAPPPAVGGALYKVIPQRSAPTQPGALFPSKQIYELGEVGTASGIAKRAMEAEDDSLAITAEMIKEQLAQHEAKEPKKPKKKSKFKF